jgi:hypothetical protein
MQNNNGIHLPSVWTDLGGITDHLTGKGGDWKDIITTTTTTQDITLNFKAGTASNEEVCKPWNWSSRSLNLRAIQRQNIHNKLQPLIKKNNTGKQQRKHW